MSKPFDQMSEAILTAYKLAKGGAADEASFVDVVNLAALLNMTSEELMDQAEQKTKANGKAVEG